jgi:hypothetical protein
METLRTVFVVAAIAIGASVVIGWLYSRAQARDRETAETAAGDLHGVATVRLPRGYRSLGLSGADHSLDPREQLARHDENQPLIFRFERDPQNDWGGHARDPELLNIVLLPPNANSDAALQDFSIGRYYSPTGSTIPLASPRWENGGDAKYRWRILAMEDHFGTDHQPRWAIAMLDAARGARADLFIWQKRARRDKALATVRDILDSLEIKPALGEHFSQTGGIEARLAKLREANIEHVFSALLPMGVQPPSSGATSFGRGVAVWLDEDRKAIRVIRILASVPLPNGAANAQRDKRHRPLLPLAMKPDQYPGPTLDGLPMLPLNMLYWNPALERWQRSLVQQGTGNEEHPLLPFEAEVVKRLDEQPGGRDAVHIILWAHWFQPPALDDARGIAGLLEQSQFWQQELLAGRIVGGKVLPSML